MTMLVPYGMISRYKIHTVYFCLVSVFIFRHRLIKALAGFPGVLLWGIRLHKTRKETWATQAPSCFKDARHFPVFHCLSELSILRPS